MFNFLLLQLCNFKASTKGEKTEQNDRKKSCWNELWDFKLWF